MICLNCDFSVKKEFARHFYCDNCQIRYICGKDDVIEENNLCAINLKNYPYVGMWLGCIDLNISNNEHFIIFSSINIMDIPTCNFSGKINEFTFKEKILMLENFIIKNKKLRNFA